MKVKAFTLTELMVVAAIISIMVVVTIVSLGGSKDNKALEMAAREVGATIREAQNNTLTGKQPVPGTLACGHGFLKEVGDDTYKLFLNFPIINNDCSTANRGHNPGQATPYVTKTLANKIKFAGNPADAIYFQMPHGTVFDKNGTQLNSGSAWRIILVSSVDASKKYTICVYSSGNVEEKKGDVAC